LNATKTSALFFQTTFLFALTEPAFCKKTGNVQKYVAKLMKTTAEKSSHALHAELSPESFQ